ncbi:MAG: hypothetical protein OXD45_00395 [Rhodobacteraceae bacterium]|nr:hypothetical protein [Paracoccaceae bacterium]
MPDFSSFSCFPKTAGPSPAVALLDSHISSQVMSRLHGPESVQSPQHDDRARFSMAAVPPSRTCTDPRGKGRGSPRMRVPLLRRPAPRGGRHRFQGLPVRRGKHIPERPVPFTITVLHQLQAGNTRHHCHRTGIPEGGRRHRYPPGARTLRPDGPEQLPGDPAGPVGTGNIMTGRQPPVDG